MGKIYNKYQELKKNDNDIMYLFRSGAFYIFINEDAEFINNIINLKLTKFGNHTKCGFPSNSLDKYLKVLNELEIKIEIIKDEATTTKIKNNAKQTNNKVIDAIKKIKLEETTPLQAIIILNDLQKTINEGE